MDRKILKAAADVMRELGLTEVKIKEADSEIFLRRSTSPCAVPTQAFPESSSKSELTNTFADYTEVKSPLIGVFYESPTPDAPPYVRIGDTVKRGDTLCIVEAMKMMNEICAEENGVVIDICAASGAMVEYGQTLFKISVQEES